MTWRDKLQPASFRGVPFAVISGSLTAGRRLARHEYPQRNLPYLEDMGRRAREYKVEAYVIGPDYMSGRDQLLAAIEEEGPGQLVHRYYGTKMVAVAECELTESTEFGGMARFTLQFVEAGEQAEPTVGIDSGAELLQVQDVAYSAIMDDFTQQFSVDALPSWGVGDILSSLIAFLELDDFRGECCTGCCGDVQAWLSGISPPGSRVRGYRPGAFSRSHDEHPDAAIRRRERGWWDHPGPIRAKCGAATAGRDDFVGQARGLGSVRRPRFRRRPVDLCRRAAGAGRYS
ncbi:DNA circularization protein [Massilia eburnea]|uniref:DNA circularization protein n=1 Tax=Massilia eburnea TaxID=1776165 RepID=UPI003D6BF2EE